MIRNAIILAVAVICGFGLAYLIEAMPQGGNQVPPAASGSGQSQSAAPASQNSAIVPDFSFVRFGNDSNAAPLQISDFRGKTVVLNFWASWCPPCLVEFPHFLKLAEQYPDEVVFIGLSSDHDLAALERFLAKMRTEHPTAMAQDNVLIALDDNGGITRGIFQTFRLPETILIDQNGVMREKLIGADWDYEDLERKIMAY
ncbi:MAG: redoxin family protein [Alphaproteobacteria bacterium]